MKILQVNNAFLMSVTAALIGLVLLMSSFLLMEPVVSQAAVDEFTVSQTITGEISFNASTTDVTMAPAIAGLTGGTSNGTTQVVVTTNNATGYNMTIQFSSSTAMYRNGGSGEIENYNPVAPGVADLAFDAGGAETFGQFAFSAYSTTNAGDIATAFLNDGGTCGAGALAAIDTCWLNPSSTAAKVIVNRVTATPSGGATTTIQFRVEVPNNPSPAIPTGTYTATATLTAITN